MLPFLWALCRSCGRQENKQRRHTHTHTKCLIAKYIMWKLLKITWLSWLTLFSKCVRSLARTQNTWKSTAITHNTPTTAVDGAETPTKKSKCNFCLQIYELHLNWLQRETKEEHIHKKKSLRNKNPKINSFPIPFNLTCSFRLQTNDLNGAIHNEFKWIEIAVALHSWR